MSLHAINGRPRRAGIPTKQPLPVPYQDYRPDDAWRCAGLPLIFSIEDDARLLAHFVAHYCTQGVTEFVACLWGNAGADDVAARLAGSPHHVIRIPGDFADGRSDSDFQDQVRRMHVPPDQWYVVADLDEFHVVPGYTLASAIVAASAAGANVIAGEFVDRVTADGSLPEALGEDLFAQFPLQTRMTQRLLTGCVQKVLCARGDVAINAGHHHHDGLAWAHQGQAHHFKWWGSVVRRNERRLAAVGRVPVDLVRERRALVDGIAANGNRLPLVFPCHQPVPENWRPRESKAGSLNEATGGNRPDTPIDFAR